MATDTAIVTIETAPKLSNGTSFTDLERPLSQISRSRYYSTSNKSKMVQDRAIGTMADNRKLYMVYRTAPLPNGDFKVRSFFDAEYLRNS